MYLPNGPHTAIEAANKLHGSNRKKQTCPPQVFLRMTSGPHDPGAQSCTTPYSATAHPTSARAMRQASPTRKDVADTSE